MSTNSREKRPSRRRTVSGPVQANRRGFGFVRPAGAEPSTTDIFLPANLMTGLLDGDTVNVTVEAGNARAVERTGRIRTEVFGQVVDGVFTTDPGVGSLTFPVTGNYRPDDVVSVELIERKGRTTAGKVTCHGRISEPETLAKLIFSRHLLPFTHTEGQIREASRVRNGQRPTAKTATRRDFRDQLVVTIDAPYSKDLDDAVAAAVDPDGHIRVWVHIADVSEHVTEGSELDREAFRTPTSVYLPDFVRPMLPSVLSDETLSLLPRTRRDTLTVEMRISPTGTISSVDVYESMISSRTRLSYTTVAAVLDGRRGDNLPALEGEDVSTPVLDTICWLWAAAARLGQARTARGGVDAFRVDHVGDADESRDDNAHLLIERLMVAANESVAHWLTERGIPTLYRTHDPITGEQAEELEKIADAFGVKAHLGRPVTAQAFAAFAASIDPARSRTLWNAILNLLGRASYSTEQKGHFGLGAGSYLHFTSPIRRYADLVVHRLVKSYLHGNRSIDGARDYLDMVAASINPIVQRADQAMREADRTAALVKSDVVNLVGKTVNGVITDITQRGLTVSFSGVSVPAFVPARAIGQGRTIDGQRRRLVNDDSQTLGIGSRVDMTISDVNVLAARIEGSLDKRRGKRPVVKEASARPAKKAVASRKRSAAQPASDKQTNAQKLAAAPTPVSSDDSSSGGRSRTGRSVAATSTKQRSRTRKASPAKASVNGATKTQPVVAATTAKRSEGVSSSGTANKPARRRRRKRAQASASA